MGGVWERLIRTVSNVLQPMLLKSGSHLDDEGLRTLFCEVMNVVNNRPLTTDTLNDEQFAAPLTPNNLLTAKTRIDSRNRAIHTQTMATCSVSSKCVLESMARGIPSITTE